MGSVDMEWRHFEEKSEMEGDYFFHLPAGYRITDDVLEQMGVQRCRELIRELKLLALERNGLGRNQCFKDKLGRLIYLRDTHRVYDEGCAEIPVKGDFLTEAQFESWKEVDFKSFPYE